MKELGGSAQTTVAATPEACFELVAAVDHYPGWNPAVRDVDVLQSNPDGRPTRVRTAVHVAAGPVARDFDLVLDVELSGSDTVCLSRVPNEAGDPEKFELVWRVSQGPPTCLAIELDAMLEVPRLLPLGGVGDRLAQEFVDAAKRELDGSSPNASASSS